MYSFQYYGVDQGLMDLAVRSLYQDARGYLWLSTENGVFRYDGERFQAFGQAEGLPASTAAMFGEAPDGSLLLGGKFGLYRMAGSDSRFERVPMPGATEVLWGSGIQSDSKGTTYIATDGGLIAMTFPLQLRLVDSPPHSGGPSAFGILAEGGSVWWGCGDEICLSKEGKMTVFGRAARLPAGAWHGMVTTGSVGARKGDLWVQSVEGQVEVLRGGKTRFEKAVLPELSGFGPRGLIRIDTEGQVMIPVADGLVINKNGRWQMVGRSSGLRGPVYAILQDREGSVWLGLSGHGLVKWLGYGQWEHFNSDSGLGSDVAYEAAPAGPGANWLGTGSGLFLGRRSALGWKWKRQAVLGDTPIHSVRPDGHGRLWLGTEGKGAARLDTITGKVQWFGAPQGLTAISPYTIMLDRENRIWAASLTGLFFADAQTLRFRRVEGLPGSTLCVAVIEGKNGDIWAGTSAGLFRLSNGKWSQLTVAQGLSNNEVLSLAADSNGDIWVGYQFGDQVDRVHAGAQGMTVTREKGGGAGSKGTTYFLGFDVRAQLWVGTNRGVDVRTASGWDHFDHHDGLVWDDCDLNAFHANEDGTVWIGTSGGLALFTPHEGAFPHGSPVAVLTRLTLGKQVVSAAESISVNHSANSLTASFSALTFARENAVLFRYRLPPLFRDWRETRERELEFPGLPPGSYRLEVQARDGWGRWSAESAAFAFEVRPPVWRSWWFLAISSIFPIAMAALTVRLRGNKMRRRQQDLVRLVDARTAELQQASAGLKQANLSLILLSSLDGLTGIANRRVFDLTLEREWERVVRSGNLLSVVIADVDHFKRLNDIAGHQAGDECLRLIAQALAETGKRRADCVARFGGEEFALLLPGADEAQAALLAETARQRVEALKYVHPDPAIGFVTISLGVATATGGNFPTPHALVGAADRLLYEAKRRGRNRVASSAKTDEAGNSVVARDFLRMAEVREKNFEPQFK